MTIRTIIVDDEELARRGLAFRLQQIPDIELLAQCSDGPEALTAIENFGPDLIFLDIEMPGMSGFDVIRRMQADDMGLVIFVTAYHQYAVDAFEVHAVDYVVKPIEDHRLHMAVARARERLSQCATFDQKKRLLDLIVSVTGKSHARIETLIQQGKSALPGYFDKIPVKERGEVVLIPPDQIAWVEAAGDLMCIHANGAIHVLRSTMKELEDRLNPVLFKRIHRSTIVNVSMITRLCPHTNGEYYLILKDGSRLKLSRTYRNNIQGIV